MKTLQEAASVSESDKHLLEEIKSTVCRFLPNAGVLVYGSVARGTNGPDSDYDILVLLEEPLERAVEESIRECLYDLQLKKDVLVCCVFRMRSQWDTPKFKITPFRREVERDGILL
jgi:uncharacterized protein